MLRLMHAKIAVLGATLGVAFSLVLTPAAWAFVKANAAQNPVRSISPADPRKDLILLPAALDPATDLEDASITTRSGISHRAILLTVADDFARTTYVPYVWGGNKVGSPSECQACRECLSKQRAKSVQRRHRGCSVCQQCGMDCSHFVNRIYSDAGIPFPYASTKILKRSSPETIRRKYGLVYVGKDLAQARPGDLILKDKHIIMLIQMRGPRRGDILHVSRSISRKGVGGVELVTDADVQRFSGRVVRIFRHELIVDEELRLLPETPAPEAPTIDWHGRQGLLVRLDTTPTQVPWLPVL